jgi:hypothetical protein
MLRRIVGPIRVMFLYRDRRSIRFTLDSLMPYCSANLHLGTPARNRSTNFRIASSPKRSRIVVWPPPWPMDVTRLVRLIPIPIRHSTSSSGPSRSGRFE